MTTTSTTTTAPSISVRFERTAAGSPNNMGHDLTLFGLFVEPEQTFCRFTRNRTASLLMERGGITHEQAREILDLVETEQHRAFEITAGEIVEL